MKIINCNDWAPYSEWDPPIPIANQPILANGDTLFYSFYVYNFRGLAIFYYLAGNVEDNYLYENN